jgi:hypothetical protein
MMLTQTAPTLNVMMAKPHVDSVVPDLQRRVYALYGKASATEKEAMLKVGFALPHHHFSMGSDETVLFEFGHDVKAVVVKTATCSAVHVCMWYSNGNEWVPVGVTADASQAVAMPSFDTTMEMSEDVGVCSLGLMCEEGFLEKTDEANRIQILERGGTVATGKVIQTMINVQNDGANGCVSSSSTSCGWESDPFRGHVQTTYVTHSSG